MIKTRNTASVADANRRFYNEIAGSYESIDRRRGGSAHAWLSLLLESLAQKIIATEKTQDLTILDAGSGTGFLLHLAKPFFKNRIAVDISEKMLEQISDPGIIKICGPLNKISLPANSISCVASFASLHHLFDPLDFFQEAHRLLKTGGVFYTDHDISSRFIQKFSPLLRAYRFFFDHGKMYLAACPKASAEDYQISEFHGDNGLDGEKLKKQLLDLGFRKVDIQYHWEGMGAFALLERIFPKTWLRKPGNAPILRIIAIK